MHRYARPARTFDLKCICLFSIFIPAALAQIHLAPAVSYNAGGLPESVAGGDLDGDGDRDLAIVNQQGHLRFLFNDGGGCMTKTVDNRSVWSASPGAPWPHLPAVLDVAIGDLNSDGKNDIAAVLSEPNGTLSVLLNQGGGTFAAPVNYSSCNYAGNLALGDLTGDGTRDAALTSSCFKASILLNNGQGSFTHVADVGERGYTTGDIELADLDGDHDNDIAFVNIGISTVSVLKNNGSGVFTEQAGYATGDNPQALVLADINGDGFRDIVTANLYSQDVTVLFNDQTGAFPTSAAFPAGVTPSGLSAADLDSDGRIDVVVSNRDNATVSVLRNTGGAFAPPVQVGTGNKPMRSVSIDLSGDARLDIAVLNRLSESVSVLLNGVNTCPAPPPSQPNPIVVPLAATPVASGGQRLVGLSWMAARSAGIALFRNGVRILVTQNDGYHWDNVTQMPGRSFRYRICEIRNFRSCSAEVVATL